MKAQQKIVTWFSHSLDDAHFSFHSSFVMGYNIMHAWCISLKKSKYVFKKGQITFDTLWRCFYLFWNEWCSMHKRSHNLFNCLFSNVNIYPDKFSGDMLEYAKRIIDGISDEICNEFFKKEKTCFTFHCVLVTYE